MKQKKRKQMQLEALAYMRKSSYEFFSDRKNYEKILKLNPDAGLLAKLEKFMREYPHSRLTGEQSDG